MDLMGYLFIYLFIYYSMNISAIAHVHVCLVFISVRSIQQARIRRVEKKIDYVLFN